MDSYCPWDSGAEARQREVGALVSAGVEPKSCGQTGWSRSVGVAEKRVVKAVVGIGAVAVVGVAVVVGTGAVAEGMIPDHRR